MRAFILVVLLAMVATVSCQDVKVSDACNATSNALEVASVTDAEKNIVKGGCTQISLDPQSSQCTFDNATSSYNCKCEQTLTGKDAWETAVRNISGLPCYLDLTISLIGTVKVDNTTTKPVAFNATQTNSGTLAVGGNCTQSDIGTVFASSVNGNLALLDPLNANSASTGITWSTGTVSVTGCGVQRSSGVVNIPQPGAGGTTAPPSSNTTSPPSTTTAPPTAPPSSTGKSGASVVASSAALVASLIAAVTILA